MANEYRLKLGIANGSGTITVNGSTPQTFYPEGANLTIAITLDPGFVSVEWFANQVSVSTALSFVYVMPAFDVAMRAEVSGTFAPIDGYGLKYYRDYGKSYAGSTCWRLEIYQDGYGGTSSEIDLENIKYRFGNLGIDPLETIVGSSLDITLAGTADQFNEFLTGDNRTWKVILKDGSDIKFVGFLSPDFVTIKDIAGIQYQTFTAVDGLKGFEAIKVKPTIFPGTPRDKAFNAIIGALNQSFVDFRNVNISCDVHETRMNSANCVFEQFFTPNISLFTEGVPIFLNGANPINNTVTLKETLESLLKPFLCRVFVYDNEFWVIRTNELANADYRAFKYLPTAALDSTNTITNGEDIECDIDNPERTARRVFTEFTAVLNLGKLEVRAGGGVYETKFNLDDWSIGSPVSTYAGIYFLPRWDYVRAVPTNQPSSVPSGDTALVQYVSGTEEACQIWTTTTTAGTSDTNISYIVGNTLDSGEPINIAVETANTISFTVQFAVVSVSGTDPGTFGNHKIGIMIKIGSQYLQRPTSTTFSWTGTANIMEFDVPNSNNYNTIQINDVIVPEDGEVEIRLYQLILNSGTRHQYTVRYKDLKLSIEENESLSLNEIAVKGITDNPYSLVHPDYETNIGDAETNASTSAIKLNITDSPVSELWSRDGVEELPLLDIIVQDLANLKGRTNQRLRGRMIRTELKPYKSYLYAGRYWMVLAFELDTYNNLATVDLFDLGEAPST